RVLHDYDLASLVVRERAVDGLARGDRDVRDRAAVITRRPREVPTARLRLRERVPRAHRDVVEGARVRKGRIEVVVEREAGRREAAAGGEREVLAAVRHGVVRDDDATALAVLEGAGDGLAGRHGDIRDR